MIMQKRKVPAQINSSDDLIKVCRELLTVDVNRKNCIDPEKFANLLKKDDSAAIRKILSRIAGKQVERLGNLVVPLQTVEVNKVFGEDLLFRPSESFVEKKLKLDKKKNSTTSTSTDKTEIKTENSIPESD